GVAVVQPERGVAGSLPNASTLSGASRSRLGDRGSVRGLRLVAVYGGGRAVGWMGGGLRAGSESGDEPAGTARWCFSGGGEHGGGQCQDAADGDDEDEDQLVTRRRSGGQDGGDGERLHAAGAHEGPAGSRPGRVLRRRSIAIRPIPGISKRVK